ncbi:hypothetical protein ACFWFI_09760 [Streptomyces sp. NPDC060209]|uniref:hypothetical protein n=1 Tax=Streptomyces sp. NPDC060209 TaxID=3347073 RepID=UPI003662E758
MAVVVQRYESMQFTGDNGETLAEWAGNAAFERVDADGYLHLLMTDADGSTFLTHINPGWWALRASGSFQGQISPEDYPNWYYELPNT